MYLTNHVVLLYVFAISFDISSFLSYCFVTGANFANKRLTPIGLGNAISNSFASPSPFTLTTVPIPHFWWEALSPTAQPICSPPVVLAAGRAKAERERVVVVVVVLLLLATLPLHQTKFHASALFHLMIPLVLSGFL